MCVNAFIFLFLLLNEMHANHQKHNSQSIIYQLSKSYSDKPKCWNILSHCSSLILPILLNFFQRKI